MKLILANNQSQKFRDFYNDLKTQASEPFDYAGYETLLFTFGLDNRSLNVRNLADNRDLTDYDGVYINGYLNTYELAAAIGISCDALGIGYANQEMTNPPSLSKLTMYTKLAAADVSVPPTIAGTKKALLMAAEQIGRLSFPAVLKRADADRGIDNYKISHPEEVAELLQDHPDRSLWLLQSYVPNNGYYLVSFYGGQPVFAIFRSLEGRPDGDERKAHMYKPKGGANASLIELTELPVAITETCRRALLAMDRQIGSADCLYNESTGQVYILEVNYNPQLVTIETFKDIRVKAFTEYLPKIGTETLVKD